MSSSAFSQGNPKKRHGRLDDPLERFPRLTAVPEISSSVLYRALQHKQFVAQLF